MDLKPAFLANFYQLGSLDPQNKGEHPAYFNIPHYQRPYKWGPETIAKFIDDLFEEQTKSNAAGSGRKYFGGAIVSVVPREGKQAHGLIDGQQRFTTLFLINYINFLTLSSFTKASIQTKTQCSKQVEKLVEAYKCMFLPFNNDPFLDFTHRLQEFFEKRLPEQGGPRNGEEFEAFETELFEQIGLPNMDYQDPDYPTRYIEEFSRFLSLRTLRLSYDREHSTKKLKAAMSKCRIDLSFGQDGRKPQLVVLKKDFDADFKEMSDYEDQFLRAIDQIFKKFIEKIDDSTSTSRAICIDLIEKKNGFLSCIEVCQVQTGDENDAYTLFEVLNDRGISLDDLDLIKNQHYRKLCNTSDSDEREHELDLLEEIWSDRVYENDIPLYKKHLVSYLAASYLTGDAELGKGQSNKFRDAVKSYLGEKLTYSFSDARKDFSIHLITKLLVDALGLKSKEREKIALACLAQADGFKSPIYRCSHLLWALKLDGVLAGLVNPILHFVFMKGGENLIRDPSVLGPKLIAEVLTSEVRSEYRSLDNIAVHLCHYAILGSTHKPARATAKEYIKRYNSQAPLTENISQIHIDSELLKSGQQSPDSQYIEWISRWRYGDSSTFKVRWLFTSLLICRLDGEGKKLELASSARALIGPGRVNTDCLNLDHFEPKTMNKDCLELYFSMDGNSEERTRIVNELGNMLPLASGTNSEKNNRPPSKFLLERPNSYKIDGMKDHWLVKELIAFYSANKDENNALKIGFFEQRKVRLIKLMRAASDCKFLINESVDIPL